MCCVNEIGTSIPLFYLFKEKSQPKIYIKNCEVGACMVAHPNAWMTKELFMNQLCHFIAIVHGDVSHENIHLLIFDGHGNHKALQTIEMINSMDIDLLTFPAHTTHRFQILDVTVFGNYKKSFRFEREM